MAQRNSNTNSSTKNKYFTWIFVIAIQIVGAFQVYADEAPSDLQNDNSLISFVRSKESVRIIKTKLECEKNCQTQYIMVLDKFLFYAFQDINARTILKIEKFCWYNGIEYASDLQINGLSCKRDGGWR